MTKLLQMVQDLDPSGQDDVGLHIASFRFSKKLPRGASWLVCVASVPHPIAYK